MIPIHKILQKLRSDGIRAIPRGVRTIYRGWADRSLDRRFKIDTAGMNDELRALGAISDRADRGYGYEPIQLRVFREIQDAWRIEPGEYTFLDLGSGKGRALILAAECGFRRVIGVEFAPALHEIAQRNVARYRNLRPAAPPVEMYLEDAASYAIPDEDLVLFLYNPFDDAVLNRVIENVEASLNRSPRRFTVVYRNPRHGDILEKSPWFRTVTKTHAFTVYEGVGPARLSASAGSDP